MLHHAIVWINRKVRLMVTMPGCLGIRSDNDAGAAADHRQGAQGNEPGSRQLQDEVSSSVPCCES